LSENLLSPKEKRNKKEPAYNANFLYDIQPAGGVSFKESYAKKGDGYEACIQIYDLPTQVDDFWLYNIFNMENVIVSIDVAATSKTEIKSNINKSLNEQLVRYYNEKDQTEKLDAGEIYKQLTETFKEISTAGEVIKGITIRLYVSGRTLNKLENNISDVLKTLEGFSFKGAVFLNETEYEWEALFNSNTKISSFPNKRVGKGISARTLAGGYPFHFTKLSDPNGTYLGNTNTGGNVLFDFFHKDKLRRFYNALIVGLMGSGKSTLLKKLALDNACRENILRIIDVTGEFKTIVDELKGKTIALDGTDGIINPLEVLKTSEKEGVSFMQHLSKLTTFYQFLSPKSSDEVIKEFELLAKKLYINFGIYNNEALEKDLNVTNRERDEYPIFSDFLKLVQNELYEDIENEIVRKNLSPSKAQRLENIELNLRSLVESYGYLFDGHSTIANILDEQIVAFGIRNLTSMKREVFNAQMFNVLNLLWDNMLKNGTKFKNLFDTNSVRWEDIVRYFIIIDEAHRIINPQNLLAVKFLTDFEREARKYFGGLIFASQSIRDYVPEGTKSEKVEEIKKLFELTQYKFIMQQDNNALKTIKSVFDGSITESELTKIPKFGEGDCLLSISGVGNITFHVDASPRELALFRGGA
jgi:DNA helicase HerA-like ATPase